MYSEYRGEPKCVVCGTARRTCGDPKLYCRSCAEALRSGRPERSNPGVISSQGTQYEPGISDAVYDGDIDRKGAPRKPLRKDNS
jgi:hypothetical protein